MKEIASGIFYSGILNPNMRIFDVIMHTDYGTSYNAYIVKGSEKIALIDASHLEFSRIFEDEVKYVIGDTPVDYLILNHTEPDHTGCIEEFIKRYPNIEIIASPAASIYIKNIVNRDDLKIRTVKDGDSLDLGGKTLKFINAPFLHWPDSMFTYVPESKVLFSCDFFGAHYCEPYIYDYNITHKAKYWDALQYYYDCIFGPFRQHVENGLKKIEGLEIDFICNSHGPILTKDNFMPKVLELYKDWSKEVKRDYKEIPIFYCTAYKNTKKLAKKVKQGILNIIPDANVETYNLIYEDMCEMRAKMNCSDAFLLGTITINRDAVPPIWELLAEIDAINMPKRPVALFGTFGWSGEAFNNVANRLKDVKAAVYEEQYKINFVPSEEQLEGAVKFGENFAKTLI